MQVIILAAGVGTRLADVEGPKALVPLDDGTTILDRQLAALSAHVEPSYVYVVVGYRADIMKEHYPNLHFIENPDYASTNTAKSLWHALEHVGTATDILWLNGDVVFHPDALEAIWEHEGSSMLANTATTAEEEIKYRCDAQGHIVKVSKTVTAAQGEAVGINRFAQKDIMALDRALEKCGDDDYFERAIQLCIDEGVKIDPVIIDDDLCVEVDFPEDLDRANSLLKGWSSVSANPDK